MTNDNTERQKKAEQDYKNRERIEVAREGEEITVWNVVNVDIPAQVRGHNPSVERYSPRITNPGAGPVFAVTPKVAEELNLEFSINLNHHDIEVVDPNGGGVHIL